MEKYGVKSEREYKERCKKNKQIMFMFQYGLTDFKKSEEGLRYIYDEVTKRGHRVDRHGFVLERMMGLPEEMRNMLPRETGLKVANKEEWKALGRITPIQPHIGDHVVGAPASVENLLGVLSAGITTVGNFSQYFTFEYPMWTDEVIRTSNMVRAMGIMAGLKDRGVMLHSNSCDGFGSQFYDRISNIAWARMEHYIINKLTGAKCTPCFGNLIDDPLTRMATVLCIDEIHEHECVGSMIYGDTISQGLDYDRNLAATSSYLINDIVMQMYHPTGHALTPCPVTEAVAIPTPDEIIQVQLLGAQLKHEAENQYELTNFEVIEDRARIMLAKSQKMFDRILDAFSDVTDITDPLKMLIGLKRLGADNLESFFSEEKPIEGLPTDRKPTLPTGVYIMLKNMINNSMSKSTATDEMKADLKGKKAIVASGDVHQYGKTVVHAVLADAGMEVKDLGPNADSDTLVQAMVDYKPDVVVLSTYNGGALSFAKKIKKLAEEKGVWDNTPIVIGGRLNDDAGQKEPVDVTEDLRQLGMHPSATIETIVELLDDILVK